MASEVQDAGPVALALDATAQMAHEELGDADCWQAWRHDMSRSVATFLRALPPGVLHLPGVSISTDALRADLADAVAALDPWSIKHART